MPLQMSPNEHAIMCEHNNITSLCEYFIDCKSGNKVQTIMKDGLFAGQSKQILIIASLIIGVNKKRLLKGIIRGMVTQELDILHKLSTWEMRKYFCRKYLMFEINYLVSK